MPRQTPPPAPFRPTYPHELDWNALPDPQLAYSQHFPTLETINGTMPVTIDGVTRTRRYSLELALNPSDTARLTHSAAKAGFNEGYPDVRVRQAPNPYPDDLRHSGWSHQLSRPDPTQPGVNTISPLYATEEQVEIPRKKKRSTRASGTATEIFRTYPTSRGKTQIEQGELQPELSYPKHVTTVFTADAGHVGERDHKYEASFDFHNYDQDNNQFIYTGHGQEYPPGSRGSEVTFPRDVPHYFATPSGRKLSLIPVPTEEPISTYSHKNYAKVVRDDHKTTTQFLQRRIDPAGQRPRSPMDAYKTATGTKSYGTYREKVYTNDSQTSFELDHNHDREIIGNELRYDNPALAASKLRGGVIIRPTVAYDAVGRASQNSRDYASTADAYDTVSGMVGHPESVVDMLCRSEGNDSEPWIAEPSAMIDELYLHEGRPLPKADGVSINNSFTGSSRPTTIDWYEEDRYPQFRGRPNPRQYGQGGVVNNVINAATEPFEELADDLVQGFRDLLR